MRYLNFAAGTASSATDHMETVMIAIDASPSMQDDDWPPSRLEAAKKAAAALIERKLRIAPTDQVGIVSYAARATTHCAPVVVGTGKAALFHAINGIRTRMWTNIAAGLKESGRSLGTETPGLVSRWFLSAPSQPVRGGRIILLSDGFHNHGEQPESVARNLKGAGVCIDCVGIGGDPSCVDADRLRRVASLQSDGITPRYAFIGDKDALITKFEQLAGRITR